jgi:predicted  nucleic acid-binding Zn-ribbon protein
MEEKYITSIATLESDVKHINRHLTSIDNTMKKMQEIIIEQNDMRKEITAALKEHEGMKKELSGYGTRLTKNEDNIKQVENALSNAPAQLKSNIVDYVWKYAALAIGGWIALKVSGILP